MWKKYLLASVIGTMSFGTIAQVKKFYTVREGEDYSKVFFSLDATSGGCYIKFSTNTSPIEIYGNPDFAEVNPSFSVSDAKNGERHVALNLEDYQNAGLAKTISMSMFDATAANKNFWKIYFNDTKIYDLNLHYGVGDANLNLTGIPIQNMKLNTGSADVMINYDAGINNPIAMDTFLVKVDMGKVIAYNLGQSNASVIMANIGFGQAILDLSDQSISPCTINATVGAGNLTVYIPEDGNVPMMINLNDSPLCRYKLDEDFVEIQKNVFANTAYTGENTNLKTFNIEVALGNIVFQKK